MMSLALAKHLLDWNPRNGQAWIWNKDIKLVDKGLTVTAPNEQITWLDLAPSPAAPRNGLLVWESVVQLLQNPCV